MSRRKKRRYEDEGTREDLSSLTLRLRSEPTRTSTSKTMRRNVGRALTLIEDFRRLDPEPFGLPKLFTGITASVGVDQPAKSKGTRFKNRVPTQIAFSAPRETIQCIRRQRRKEVMFAKNKAGKGGQRRAKWSRWSEYKC